MVYGVSENISNIFHFTNDFEANFKKKLSEVVTERNNIIKSAVYCIKNPPNEKNKLCIVDFEIFVFQ